MAKINYSGATFSVGQQVPDYTAGVGNSTGYICTRAGIGAAPWQPNKVYNLGTYVTPVTDNGHVYVVSNPLNNGTSGSTQPVFPTGSSATVVDNTITWQEAGTSALFAGFAANERFNVKDFGAVGNGIADDTLAIQAAINAAVLAGGFAGSAGFVFVPSGLYKITSTLTWLSGFGGGIAGSGNNNSIFLWAGSSNPGSPIPLLQIFSSQKSSFSDFRINPTLSTLPLDVAILLETQGGIAVSRQNQFHNLIIDGTSVNDGKLNVISTCIKIGGNGAGNNDFHSFYDCDFANYGGVGIEIDDSQVYQVQLFNCQCLGTAQTIGTHGIANSGGFMNAGDNTLKHPGIFSAKDVGRTIEVTDNSSIVLRTTIASITDSTHCVLTVGPSHQVGTSSGVNDGYIFYGSQVGLRMSGGGSFEWINGGSNACVIADFDLLSFANDGPIIVQGAVFEGSRALLRTGGPSSITKPTVFDSIRWAGSGAVSYVPVIAWGLGGHLEFRNSFIGDLDVALPITIDLFPGSVPGYYTFSMIGTFITSTFSVANTFTSGVYPTRIEDSYHHQTADGVNITITPLAETALGAQVTGTVHLMWTQKTQFLVIDGNTTFEFDGFIASFGINISQFPELGLGGTMKLWLQSNVPGPFVLTWPSYVVWDKNEPPVLAPTYESLGYTAICVEFTYEDRSPYLPNNNNITGPILFGRVIFDPTLGGGGSFRTNAAGANTAKAITIPSSSSGNLVVSDYQVDVVALTSDGYGASWRNLHVSYMGSGISQTMTLIGSGITSVAPTVNSGGSSAGLTVSVVLGLVTGGTDLRVNVNQVAGGFHTDWYVKIKTIGVFGT